MSVYAGDATLLVGNQASGELVVCSVGLSFWGGVDPDTGVVIDAHHPNYGAELAGRVVAMPSSRGSCSGSGVLLELARNAKAPAALVFRDAEQTLTLGAIIADRLFNTSVVVLRVSEDIFDALSRAHYCEVSDNKLLFNHLEVLLHKNEPMVATLNPTDQAWLDGDGGPALQFAMEVVSTMAVIQNADGLVDVTRGHIDGCILAHDANLLFAEKMQRMGATTRIPTSINAISVDRANWVAQGVDQSFGKKASRLADAYVAMGARSTFTCAPYLLDGAPAETENIGWSESNAVIFANSVLGARTEKHPDYLDLFIAMTGRAPNTGVYLEENRRPGKIIQVQLPSSYDDSLWPLIGWLAGMLSPLKIPRLEGLESTQLSDDDLRALCAAFGTTSAAPMLHIMGHTPECTLSPTPDAQVASITTDDLLAAWHRFNVGSDRVDLVAIGSPHASLTELRQLDALFKDQHSHPDTAMIVTTGRDVFAKAQDSGIVPRLRKAGVQIIPDLCWCSITEPVFPRGTRVLMTNSGKYSHYANGLTGCAVRFGSLADCVNTAITGVALKRTPSWLKG